LAGTLPVAGVVSGLIYPGMTRRLRRRRKIHDAPFPEEWERILERDVAFFGGAPFWDLAQPESLRSQLALPMRKRREVQEVLPRQGTVVATSKGTQVMHDRRPPTHGQR